jgi:hypothetical protein
VYALAAVAYEALSGARARPESTPIAVAHAIATQPPPNLRDVWPEAPKAAAEVLRAAMAREPARRPQSASLFVGELRAALEDTGRTGRTAVRRPSGAGAAGRAAVPAAAAAAAAGAAGAEAARADAPSHRGRATGAPARGRAGAAGRGGAPAAAPPPRNRPPREPSDGRSGWLVPLLLVLLLAIAGAAVALATSGSGGTSSHSSTGSTTPPATSHSTTHTQSTPSHTASSTQSSSASQSQSQSTTTGSATTPSTSTPSTSSTPSTGSASGSSTSGGAGTPVGAVKSFYELAASHQYASAWRLADPAFQSQLGGYNSFQSQQSGDRQIIFHEARVTNQSGNTATVAIRTTSIRNDGTQQCAGNVQLARSGGSSWLLHQIAINCA